MAFVPKTILAPDILIFITALIQSWSYFCIQFILYCFLGSLKTWGERERERASERESERERARETLKKPS